MTWAHAGTVRWNSDKPHRCPACHSVAIEGHRPRSLTVYQCCRCAVRFTRWPVLARLLPEAGLQCPWHPNVRYGVLDDALNVIDSPRWRGGQLSWEGAFSAVQRLQYGLGPGSELLREKQ